MQYKEHHYYTLGGHDCGRLAGISERQGKYLYFHGGLKCKLCLAPACWFLNGTIDHARCEMHSSRASVVEDYNK